MNSPPKGTAWHKVGERGFFRAFAIDNRGVFWIAISRRTGLTFATIAFTFAVVVITLSVVALSNTGNISKQQGRIASQQARLRVQQTRLHDSAYGECSRVQILRADVNRFVATIYTFVDAARRARAAEARHSHQPSDAVAAKAYRQIEEAIFFIPETDCVRAIERPLTYAPPQPIPEKKAITRGLVTPLRVNP